MKHSQHTTNKARNILVTGGAGFIGSNFIPLYIHNNPQDNIINLDLLTYAGSLDNLKSMANHPNYTFIQGDICDTNLLERIFDTHKIDSVIHFAAESHVDNSIASPDIFIKTNIQGTFQLLHTAYRFWFASPFVQKEGFEDALFHHISTDEVFGSLGESGYFSETSPYVPNSPYSASKASSDMLVRSYTHTYGLNCVITNCSNNYGPHQHDEKLIPTIIRNALNGHEIPIYGDGKNVRDWLFVGDHCRGIEAVFKYALHEVRTKGNSRNLLDSQKLGNSLQNTPQHSQGFFNTFCIGANEEHKNLEIAIKICEILDSKIPQSHSYKEQIRFVSDRAGHDKRYAIDAKKIRETLHFNIVSNFATNLNTTIDYYCNKYRGGVG
ncbi:dTDP-glucose 4,6-dehydratase [Helicobacter didelphidarum]|uniref:dTDP-glucose 4,6-dehydratase n=1 Tax=Helicobacter didelphidarum TaxID=2040648 RepID=A0A3D8IEC0_9HELI|nr:dTDP-glucose 4,6-dehydratase [Helicobacter didelphidarum]RDU63573.1 dTDP-glucose 4,6-dehydratase [Helicobacter didelphidarum]